MASLAVLVCSYFPPSVSKFPRLLPFFFFFSILFPLFLPSHSGSLRFKLPPFFSFKRAFSRQKKSCSPSILLSSPVSHIRFLSFFLPSPAACLGEGERGTVSLFFFYYFFLIFIFMWGPKNGFQQFEKSCFIKSTFS
jgi:hypothetical protein